MIDKLLAFLALAGLFTFLGFILWRVPEIDFAIVVFVVLAMVTFDFIRELFLKKR